MQQGTTSTAMAAAGNNIMAQDSSVVMALADFDGKRAGETPSATTSVVMTTDEDNTMAQDGLCLKGQPLKWDL